MNQIELNKLQAETYDHLWNGRYRLALKTATTLYQYKPNDSEAAVCLAWALLENGSPSKSMEYANLAVELNGDSIRTHLCRGYILMRLSIYEGAISDLENAIEDQQVLLGWSFLNKARALAGQRKFQDAKTSLKLCHLIDSNKNSAWQELTKYYDMALEIDEGGKGITQKKINKVIELAHESLKDKEAWFALFVAGEILKNNKLEKYFDEIKLLELEGMLLLYRYRPAMEKAEELKTKFKKSKKFKQIYSAILKMNKEKSEDSDLLSKTSMIDLKSDEKIEVAKEETVEFSSDEKKSDAAYYQNENVEVFSVKIFDQNLFAKRKVKKYITQFNVENINEIGIEIVFSNPNFRIEDKIFSCNASWYLNDFEIFRNNFSLKVDKKWDSVIFTQQCGEEEDTNWTVGQGKVEFYVDEFKVCEKWFFINTTEIEEAKDEIPPEEVTDTIEEDKAAPLPNSSEETHPPIKARSLEVLLEELDSYTGLDNVKKAVHNFIDYLKFQKERQKKGLKATKGISINALFIGNPGTGKTTIARLLGEIFKSMGIVEKGHVVDVDRAAMVGQYIGETAQKTDKLITDAMGGILFIDEAYTLIKKGGGQDFGQEAIDILLKRMEDRKGEFVVIAAGYPDEMNLFIESNPGLKSRFNHSFTFDDYTPDELIEIFKRYCKEEEYTFTDVALTELKKELVKLYRQRDKSFGNARLVRQLFEQSKLQLSKRYLALPEEEQTKESMITIEVDDIKESLKEEGQKLFSLTVDEESLTESLNELHNLVGLELVKRDVRDIVKLVRYFNEQGENIKDKFSSHILFFGNPGTGKTTVARIISRIYSSLGILPKGHLVEVDRQALVASHIGGTAQKTTQAIDKSIGGTLFIDEAYALAPADKSSNDFGKEAIDTLLKRMEDDRGKFIVIAAGYTDEMKQFVRSNPGIQSRFTKTFTFEDYTPDHLIEITERILKSKELILSDDAKEKLVGHYNEIYRSRDKQFGNARVVRNLLENISQKRLLRLADLSSEEREEINANEISEEDVSAALGKTEEKKVYEVKGDPEKLEKLMNELKNLTGLDTVKENVEKLISSLNVAKLRKERGLKVIEKSLHSVFMGNPGTGKTVVARLLSKIYKELGLIERGHLVEVDRSALVAGYSGQTAIKTDKVIESALGGTLFIDEAYTLSRGGSDFGQEAIDTLLKRMEDYRDQIIIIVAGYTDEMKQFLDSNPGLKSRFNNVFMFEDYKPRQLLNIAAAIVEESGYQLDEGALQLFLNVFEELYTKRDKNFGNARTAKNILYKAISYQEQRISSMYDYSDEDLITIIYDDVSKIKLDEI